MISGSEMGMAVAKAQLEMCLSSMYEAHGSVPSATQNLVCGTHSTWEVATLTVV